MRKLDTQFATTVVTQPLKAGSVNHIQTAYQEALDALAKSVIGPAALINTVYILFGCVNSGTGGTFIISAGAVYYNGEVYLVDAITLTPGGGLVPVAAIATTYFADVSADPVTFSDTSTHNVHQIRKIVIAAGTTGTTIADFANFKHTSMILVNDQEASLGSGYVVKFDQDKSVFFAAAPSNATITFDFTNAVPGAVVRLKWTFAGAETLTVTAGAGQTILRESGDLGLVGTSTNILCMLYAGKNEAGNDEVSYVLSQAV